MCVFSFAPLQVAGFSVLLVGTLVYNELLVVPGVGVGGGANRELTETLVEEDEADRLLPSTRTIG